MKTTKQIGQIGGQPWNPMMQSSQVAGRGVRHSYTGGYGEYIEGYVGDAHMVVSYCHSLGVESWYNDNWTKSAALDLPRSFHQIGMLVPFKEETLELHLNSLNIFFRGGKCENAN